MIIKVGTREIEVERSLGKNETILRIKHNDSCQTVRMNTSETAALIAALKEEFPRKI